eukprot:1037517-Amphidinium_carterae.1
MGPTLGCMSFNELWGPAWSNCNHQILVKVAGIVPERLKGRSTANSKAHHKMRNVGRGWMKSGTHTRKE